MAFMLTPAGQRRCQLSDENASQQQVSGQQMCSVTLHSLNLSPKLCCVEMVSKKTIVNVLLYMGPEHDVTDGLRHTCTLSGNSKRPGGEQHHERLKLRPLIWVQNCDCSLNGTISIKAVQGHSRAGPGALAVFFLKWAELRTGPNRGGQSKGAAFAAAAGDVIISGDLRPQVFNQGGVAG